MSKDRRLGRGLAALLGTPIGEAPESDGADGHIVPMYEPAGEHPASGADADTRSTSTDAGQCGTEAGILNLNVYEIDDNPFQPRRDFSEPEIASLAESLKEHDMLQPVLVRRVGERFQLISGERRLRAAIQAGWKTVPARLREADDRLVAELAIVENLQRQDLNAIEKALSFKRYLDQHGCTQEDLARRLKIDRSTIANLMRLLELPEPVQDALSRGHVSAGHARALLPLGDEREQLAFCQRIQADGLSVRETERLVQEKIRSEDEPELGIVGANIAKKKRTRSEQVASLEQEFRMALGTKVDLKPGSRGRGRIVVHFTSHEEFERIHDLITEAGGTIRSQAG